MDRDGERVQLDCADEEIVARVAAIDVAKDSGMVCTRVPHPTSPRRRTTTVWSVPTRTSTIMNLAERLAGDGIERVVLESTSEYWRPFYYLLEARGLTVWVVNACEVKNVPGRPKTSSTRCGWPSSPSVGCCGPRSSRLRRSVNCGTTPGCGST